MKRILIVFLFSVILFNLAHAQTAMGFFHLGADLYIKGHLDQAIQVVQEGLQKYPNDPYLNALSKKLKQKKQQRQQQQQRQNQQQQQQQKKQEQKKLQAQKEKQKQEKQKQQQQQKQKGQKKQMTKKEAERILQALKEENKKFKKEHLRVPAGRRQMDKNW